jgi:hypothetical protein
MYRSVLIAFASTTLVAHAAEPGKSLARWPVASMQAVAATEYREAAAAAAGGAAPLDVALRVVGAFEGSTQHIIQTNEGSEAPVRSRVTVIRDGLLDDSIRGERWDIVLERRGTGAWAIKEVKRAWSCRRGAGQQRFATSKCQ